MPRLLELAPQPSGPRPTVFASKTLEYMQPTRRELMLASGIVGLVKREGPVLKAFDLFAKFHDAYTAEHSERVAFGSAILANRLGLSFGAEVMAVRIALMHDIGKENDETQPVVRSKERFSGLERVLAMDILHKHPTAGAELVLMSDWNTTVRRQVASGVAAHQFFSNVDSYGKAPDSDVVLPAQIVAFVDTADALASERPYKPSYSYEVTRDTASRQFTGNVAIAAACFGPIQPGRLDIPRQIVLPDQHASV